MTVAQIFGMDQSVISEANLEIGMGGMLEGVCLGYANECRVSELMFMVVQVDTGLVAVGGVFVQVNVAELVIVTAADALPRYDRIVVRRDNATNVVWIGVKKGTPAAAPVPPSLTRSGGIYEISLAKVYVSLAGGGFLYNKDITDERGSPSVCGYISFKAYNQVQRAAVEGWRQRGSWSARASAAAATALDGTGLYLGVVNTDNARAGVQDADGVALQQDTSAAPNNVAIVYTPLPSVFHGRFCSPIWECKFKLAAVANNERLGIGIGNIADPTAADNPGGDHLILQYSTSRLDTNFMFSTQGAGRNLIDTGVLADAAAHIFRIIADSSSAILELMDTNRNIQARVRVTTNLPVAATGLHPASALRNLAAAAKTIYQYYATGINRNI